VNTYNIKLTDDLTIPVRAKSAEEAQRIIRAEMVKREASPLFDKVYFDYETGINVPRLRAALGRQEKIEEKENVLNAYVDEDGYTMTTKGDFAITPEGQRALADKGLLDREKISDKNIVIEENKFGTAGDYADFSGAVGPIFGAISALSPQLRIAKGIQYFFKSPAVSNAIAAGLGSAGGKAAEEGLDLAQGYQEKDANELADLLQFEFGVGTVGQGIGEIGAKAFGAFFGRKAPVENIRDAYVANKGYSMDDVLRLDEKLGRLATETDIKKAAKSGQVKDLNVRAVLSQRALGRALPARFQGAGETIFGKIGREQGIIDYNIASLNQLKNKIADKRAKLESYSAFAESDSRVISELKARRTELDQAEVGIQNELTRLLKDLSNETAGFDSSIMNAAVPGKKELGENVQETLSKAYSEIQKNHRVNYRAIEGRILNVDPDFYVPGDDILTYLEETFARTKGLGKIGAPERSLKLYKQLIDEKKSIGEGQELKFSIDDLVELRKDLKSDRLIAELGGDRKGMTITSKLIEFVEDKIDGVAKGRLQSTASKLDKEGQEKVTQIIKDLKSENNMYRLNQIPFDNAKIVKLKNDLSKNGTPVLRIYNEIFKPGFDAADMQSLFQALKPVRGAGDKIIFETKEQAIKQGLLRKFLTDTAEDAIDDPISKNVNPVKYASKILANKDKLKFLLGKNSTGFFQAIDDFSKLKPNLKYDELKNIADELSGRIPQMESLPEKYLAKEFKKSGVYPSSFERFAQALKEKAETSAQSLEIQKSNIFTRLESASPEEVAKIVFRPKSSEDILRVKNLISEEAFLDIQDQALEQILKDSVQTGSTKLADIFKPGNLERALRTYDNETLTAMFGKDLTQSLNNYSRQLRVTIGDETTGGAGSLVAGALALNVFNVALWPTVAVMGLYKTIFSNPRITSLLAKTDKSSIAEVLRFVERTIRFGSIQGLGTESIRGSEALNREIEKLQKSKEGQEVKGILESLKSQGQSEVKKLQTPTLQGLPEVAAVTPPQSQGVISQSLLGGSPANMDIAQSLGRLA